MYKPFGLIAFSHSHCFRRLSLQLSSSLSFSRSSSPSASEGFQAVCRNLRQMKGFLQETWMKFCKLIKFSPPAQRAHISLREKAIAVAERVTTVKDRESSKVSCPVCFDVMQASSGADLRMTLALHLSLWHPDDVKLQWDITQRKKYVLGVHLPSLIFGVGVAAGFGALVVISARNRTLKTPVKVRRKS